MAMRPHAFVVRSNECLRRSSGQSNRFCFRHDRQAALASQPTNCDPAVRHTTGPALARATRSCLIAVASPALHPSSALVSRARESLRSGDRVVAVTGGSAYDLRTRSAKASVVRSSQSSFPPLTALTLESTLHRRSLLRFEERRSGSPTLARLTSARPGASRSCGSLPAGPLSDDDLPWHRRIAQTDDEWQLTA